MKSRDTATAIVMALVVTLAMPAAQSPVADRTIQRDVEQRLLFRNLQGVLVTVDSGLVTLKGSVLSAWERKQAYEEAKQVNGVRLVRSELAVLRGESDSEIARQVRRRVASYAFYTTFDSVDADVESGTVLLSGWVLDEARAKAIVDLVAGVHGVVEVMNLVRTLPVSPKDDEIRYEIAARIYDDPLFRAYMDLLPVPIHIIVEHGHVTLTGIVESEVHRRTAEEIACRVFGVVRVENRLVTRRLT
jgi:osmotically-inducible protein OsmY